MRELFQVILYQPMFNGFVGLYHLIPDVGVVILLLTIIIKAILYPLTSSSIKSQKSLADLQPKLEELKKKYKDNQQMMAQETMKLYKENKVNPLGSCLPILIQLPVFIALYWVLQAGLTSDNFSQLYPFIPTPEHINTKSLGIMDLKNPNPLLALFAGLAQYWQARMMIRKQPPKAAGEGGKDESMMAMMNKQMLYFMPVMTFLIGFQLPGGLSLYWFFSTVLTALQQKVLFKKDDNTPPTPPGVIEGKIVQ
ncbi:MAG TPA: YidC/Oxa1 family membrane protein insertase [Candidatus Kapabacteria bacterium]|nr:YidC/Oxa1 family membrane protein insertase [Candidatus Kapabacteria bacterium]